MKYRILITGSRTWIDKWSIAHVLRNHIEQEVFAKGITNSHKEITIVHGDCPSGADYLADQIAAEWGMPVEKYPANWKEYGRKAGFMRNAEMVHSNPDACFAFILDHSRGATHCAAYAEEYGIPTFALSVQSSNSEI